MLSSQNYLSKEVKPLFFLLCAFVFTLIAALPTNGSVLNKISSDHQSIGYAGFHTVSDLPVPVEMACDAKSSLHCGMKVTAATPAQTVLVVVHRAIFTLIQDMPQKAMLHQDDPPPPRI